jgi:acid phosphatase family membrane protein YuiD
MKYWLSPYLLAIVVTWLLAHIIKYVIAIAKRKQLSFGKQVFVSGGMPSAHVSTAVALTVVILSIKGYNSGLLALSVLFTLIVAHDSVRVRRSSGEQGAALIQVIKETKSSAKIPIVAKGHTPQEVIVGALFGAVMGIIVFLATR